MSCSAPRANSGAAPARSSALLERATTRIWEQHSTHPDALARSLASTRVQSRPLRQDEHANHGSAPCCRVWAKSSRRPRVCVELEVAGRRRSIVLARFSKGGDAGSTHFEPVSQANQIRNFLPAYAFHIVE